jgi:hypothetical protein
LVCTPVHDGTGVKERDGDSRAETGRESREMGAERRAFKKNSIKGAGVTGV